MNYIDASTQGSLKQGIMDFLNLNENELQEIFETIYYEKEKGPWEWLNDFLSDYIVDETLDYIQMFHLTRRLNGTDLSVNNNLKQLLLEENKVYDYEIIKLSE